jgi:hypothetical protein
LLAAVPSTVRYCTCTTPAVPPLRSTRRVATGLVSETEMAVSAKSSTAGSSTLVVHSQVSSAPLVTVITNWLPVPVSGEWSDRVQPAQVYWVPLTETWASTELVSTVPNP